MNIIHTQSIPVPSGTSEVGFVLTVPPPIGTGVAVAVIEVLGLDGTRLAARVVRRIDVVDTTRQKFGILVSRSRKQFVVTRVQAVRGVRVQQVVSRSVGAIATAICPLIGVAGRPKQWGISRSPKSYMRVRIDPNFAKFVDGTNTQIYYRIQEALWCIGRVCGLGFLPSNISTAHIAFHQASAERIEDLSIQFGNALEWFGTSAYGSVYLAVHPNNKDVWIGHRLKDSQGGGKLSSTNIIRFVLNAFFQTKMGFPYHWEGAPICAVDNTNFSGPIKFSRHDPNCLAGMDGYNQKVLREKYGSQWLGRWDD